MGELRELDDHLNYKAQRPRQLEGCQYTKIRCFHCSELFQRSAIQNHQKNQCLKRPFSCQYCKKFNSTYEDVIVNHWSACGSYPISCPSNCGEFLPHQNCKSHIANDCPLTVIDCDFKHVGCDVRLPRKDMPAHLTASLASHASLHIVSHRELKEENDLLKQQVQEQQEKIATLTHDLQTLHSKQNEQLRQQIDELKQAILALSINSTPNCVDLIMNDYEEHRKNKTAWTSPPFYTHPRGYKMRLAVNVNGYSEGRRRYLSVFIQLMSGEFDSILMWPFRGSITIEMVNGEGQSSFRGTVDCSDRVLERVADGRAASKGWGFHKFISHTALQPLLNGDSLRFRISPISVILPPQEPREDVSPHV